MINHRIASIGALCGAIIAGVVFAGGLHLWSGGEAQADHSNSTVDLAAIDMDITGNTATSFGVTDTCARIESGASLSLDVIVDAIPEDRPLVAYQFELFYDPAIVHVTDIDHEMLMAANDFQPFVILTELRPDSDGSFLVGLVDATSNAESGPGVLARITLTGVGTGVSNLSLIAFQIRDDRNEAMIPTSQEAANITVGQDCPSEAPTPINNPPPTVPTPDTILTPPPDGGADPGTGGTPGTESTPGSGISEELTTPAAGGAELEPGTGDDADGVLGVSDQCSGTADDASVDASGCSAPQLEQLAEEAKERLLEELTTGLALNASLDLVTAGGSTAILAAFADENGEPVSGTDVTFKIEEQPGDDSNLEGDLDVTKTSDAEGIAEATLSVGSTPGEIIVSATAEGETETVTITVIEQAATEGDDGGGGIGAWIAAPIIAALLALAGGGYWVYRRRLQKAP